MTNSYQQDDDLNLYRVLKNDMQSRRTISLLNTFNLGICIFGLEYGAISTRGFSENPEIGIAFALGAAYSTAMLYAVWKRNKADSAKLSELEKKVGVAIK
jgi:hypothetical protein